MYKKESIYELHQDHKEWMSKLNFYKDDIKILRHRLEEIVSKNTDHAVLAEAEKFQNQFIVQEESADHLRHFISLDEDKIQQKIDSNPKVLERKKVAAHKNEQDLVENFEKNFKLLRNEFYSFAEKWM